ncbi:hypothetical protein [Brevundimonas sp. Marseille-Q4549]
MNERLEVVVSEGFDQPRLFLHADKIGNVTETVGHRPDAAGVQPLKKFSHR